MTTGGLWGPDARAGQDQGWGVPRGSRLRLQSRHSGDEGQPSLRVTAGKAQGGAAVPAHVTRGYFCLSLTRRRLSPCPLSPEHTTPHANLFGGWEMLPSCTEAHALRQPNCRVWRAVWSGPAQREAPWFVGFQSTLSSWLLRGSHPRGWARGGSPRKWSPEAAGEQAQGPPTGHRGNRRDQADIWAVRGTRSPWAGSSAELGVGGDPGRRGSKLVPARGALPVQWGRSAQVWPQPLGALVGVSRASPSWVSRGDTVDRGHLAPVRGARRTEAGRECTQDLSSHGAVDGSLPPGHQPAPPQKWPCAAP